MFGRQLPADVRFPHGFDDVPGSRLAGLGRCDLGGAFGSLQGLGELPPRLAALDGVRAPSAHQRRRAFIDAVHAKGLAPRPNGEHADAEPVRHGCGRLAPYGLGQLPIEDDRAGPFPRWRLRPGDATVGQANDLDFTADGAGDRGAVLETWRAVGADQFGAVVGVHGLDCTTAAKAMPWHSRISAIQSRGTWQVFLRRNEPGLLCKLAGQPFCFRLIPDVTRDSRDNGVWRIVYDNIQR